MINHVPKNKVWFAFLLAVLAHSILLATKFTLGVNTKQQSSQITVQIQKLEVNYDNAAETVPEPVEKTLTSEEIKPAEIDQVTPPKPVPKDILVSKPNPEASQPKKLVVQTSSQQFQKFIQQETQSFSVKNPEKVASFGQTFNEPVEQVNTIDNDDMSAKTQVRRVGVHATHNKDGSRTCYAQILNMLDISAEASYTSKDCTPKKEFDLKLGQPNNG